MAGCAICIILSVRGRAALPARHPGCRESRWYSLRICNINFSLIVIDEPDSGILPLIGQPDGIPLHFRPAEIFCDYKEDDKFVWPRRPRVSFVIVLSSHVRDRTSRNRPYSSPINGRQLNQLGETPPSRLRDYAHRTPERDF